MKLKFNLAAKIAEAKAMDDLTYQDINTARGSAGEIGQFAHLVTDGCCPSCGREWSEFGGCRWTDCPENIKEDD